MGFRWVLGGLLLAGVLAGLYFLNAKTNGGKTLHVYSWSNYFPEDQIREFEQKNGISVAISYFSSNEELFAKMVAGASGYDVVLPSDYMISRMIGRKMLRALDKSALPSLGNLSPEFLKSPYDVGLNFCVPYTSGNTGLLVNTEAVKLENDSVSWGLLLDSPHPHHTSLLDDMREVFAASLFWKGFSPNERNPSILAAMKQALSATKKRMTLFSSEPAPLAIKGEIHIAHAFTNHAVQAAAENPAFKFFLPVEGAITWTDNLAIPADAVHVKEAHAFIEFFLDPQNGVAATRTNGLGTPNLEAWKLLSKEEQTDPVLYPSPEQKKRLRYLEDLQGDALQNMNRLWTEMKSG